jgi:endoglucanase
MHARLGPRRHADYYYHYKIFYLLVLFAHALTTFAQAVADVSAEDDYSQILGMSYLFYEGQMSGKLPSWNRLLYSKPPAGYKKDAHLTDGSPIGKDLAGGYYDAGGKCCCSLCVAMPAGRLTAVQHRSMHGDTDVNQL